MHLHGFLDFVIPEPKGRLHKLKEEENKKKKFTNQKLVYTFETLIHPPPHTHTATAVLFKQLWSQKTSDKKTISCNLPVVTTRGRSATSQNPVTALQLQSTLICHTGLASALYLKMICN